MIKLRIKQNHIPLRIGYAIKTIGTLPEATVEKLRNWMRSKGYEVEGLTIIEMIDLLVGELKAKYFLKDGDLYVEDKQAFIDEDGNLHLFSGASIVDGNLYLKDV